MDEQRLDSAISERGLARSREKARAMIKAGRVSVDGRVVKKAATAVGENSRIEIAAAPEDRWASRGALKLLSVLDLWEPQGLSLAGKRVLDAGASTGGFSDVCLDRGAKKVYAVDVGHDQLIARLAEDPRIKNLEGTNIRELDRHMLDGEAVDLMVGDLSFISLKLVLPVIAQCVREGADLLPMVKPQFEVGKERLSRTGVVKSPELRAEVTLDIARCAADLGLSTLGVVASALPGPSGNVEYFLWLRADAGAQAPSETQLSDMVSRAIKEGPQ